MSAAAESPAAVPPAAAPPAVRAIVLSDLHLGDTDSLLTTPAPDAESLPSASPVLVQLATCLRQIAAGQDEPPLIVLNGDILELSFGPTSHALAAFEGFLRLLAGGEPDLSRRVVYVPGNHDHHVWELARQTQYERALADLSHDQAPPGSRHVTGPLLTDAVPDRLLGALLRRARATAGATNTGDAGPLLVCYPNLVLRDAAGARVVIHHGHFTEPIYTFLSRARRFLFPSRSPVTTVEQLESENFAWIEFVWSLLGRSGAAGEDVEHVFEMLRYPQRTKAFVHDVATRAAKRRLPYLPFAWMRRFLLRRVLGGIARSMEGERLQGDEAFGASLRSGVAEYVFGPVARLLDDGLGGLRADTTFVFGHTHKPFEASVSPSDSRRPDRLLDPDAPPVRVVNSGGWTVDTARRHRSYGACAVLVDENLSVLPLRMFSDTLGAPPDRSESAEAAARVGDAGSPLAQALRARLASDPEPWSRLARLVGEQSEQLRARHRERFGSG